MIKLDDISISFLVYESCIVSTAKIQIGYKLAKSETYNQSYEQNQNNRKPDH